MPASRHSVQDVAEEKFSGIPVRNTIGTGHPDHRERSCDLAIKVKMVHDSVTDVMHVDLLFPAGDSVVSVLDVGDCLGFPGQVVARVDLENRILYGLTIQRFASFKRKLLWRYRMASIRRALVLLLSTLRIGLAIDQHSHHLPSHA